MSEAADFEPYVTTRRLESGPTSDTFEARHKELGRLVWLKVLRPHVPLSSPFALRLEREAHFLARLAHPNVVSILDCVRRPPRLWLVLEAVDGWNLAEVLAALRRGRGDSGFETSGAVALVLQIARGLGHAHEQGIVHGAIAPKHILVGKDGACKLSGFVAAESVDNRGETSDVEPGAFEPAYSSPEQVLGESVDERSDMFSLGVVFYELLAGRRPFEADRESHTAQSIRHDAPEPLGPKRPDVSPELERIVQRCLEKSRERRFDSLGQLIRALEHLLGAQALGELCPMVARALGEAGLAVPSAAPGPRTREGELRRREAGRGLRQSLVMLALISVFTLSGGAALYSWLDAERAAPNVTPAVLEKGGRGELLVVADPWAHVFVDGEQVETTPFATPLLLTPGVRHVRLEHPTAPAEQRRIEVTAGQRIVLEVEMKVAKDVLDAGAAPALKEPDASRATP